MNATQHPDAAAIIEHLRFLGARDVRDDLPVLRADEIQPGDLIASTFWGDFVVVNVTAHGTKGQTVEIVGHMAHLPKDRRNFRVPAESGIALRMRVEVDEPKITPLQALDNAIALARTDVLDARTQAESVAREEFHAGLVRAREIFTEGV